MGIKEGSQVSKLSREELYSLVWQKPIIRLAEEFGLSDQGLAKICRKFEIPRPPRGYWAKLEAGKNVEQAPLPAPPAGFSKIIVIRSSEPQSDAIKEARQASKAFEEKIEVVQIPEDLRRLHPVVAGWVAKHKADQSKRRTERRNSRNSWYVRDPISDLTEKDSYRFRVTSAFLKAVEKHGFAVKSSHVKGSIELEVSGETLEVAIAQKMMRKLKAGPDDEGWTAFPEHHQAGLYPSGFLRFSIKGWGISQKDYIETEKRKADKLLFKLIARVLAAEPELLQRRKEHEEWQRKYEQERAERAERERLEKLDAQRWERLISKAQDRSLSRQIRSFIEEVRVASASREIVEIDGKSIDEWLEWAGAKAEELDPLNSVEDIFALPKDPYSFGRW